MPCTYPILGCCTACPPTSFTDERYDNTQCCGAFTPPNAWTHNGQITFTSGKIGFKNVQARKSWHGRLPWISNECNTPATPDDTKYRHIRREVRMQWQWWDLTGTPVLHNEDQTMVREYEVDRYSGKVTEIACSNFADLSPQEPPGDPTDWIQLSYGCVAPGDGFGFTTVASAAILNDTTDFPNGSFFEYGFETETRITRSASATVLSVEIYSDRHLHPDDPYPTIATVTVTVTLSVPYTSANLLTDITSLLSNWDMTKDDEYPWRTDEYCTMAPFLDCDEPTYGVDPDTIHTCGWTDSSTCTGATRGAPKSAGYRDFYDVLHPVMHYDSGWVIDSYGAWSPSYLPRNVTQWTRTDDACLTFRPGAMVDMRTNGSCFAQKWVELKISRPSHNYFRPCGTDRYLIDETTVRCISSFAGSPPQAVLSGTDPGWATNDYCIVTGATNPGVWQVTRISALTYRLDSKKADLPSWWSYESGVMGKCRFWTTAWPVCGKLGVTDATNASPIRITTASACDLLTGDQVLIWGVGGNTAANANWTVTRVDSTHFDLQGSTGNAAFTTSGWLKSSGAPDPIWSDATPKGDVDLLTGTYCTRPGSSNTVSCATGNVAYGGCVPAICISPNGESFVGGVTYGFGGLIDQRYGARWQAHIVQFAQDPFWQTPHTPCAGGAWAEDQGSCTGNYAHRPLEEARCAPPVGAPALPGGLTIHCQSGDPCGLPGTVGNAGDDPNTCDTAWGLYLRQQACVCASGAFAAAYEADGVVC